MSGGLAGRTVAVTRPERACAKARRAGEPFGATIRCYPLIEVILRGDAELVAAVLPEYDWLLFTSANGVRAYALARRKGGAGTPEKSRAACVGPQTVQAARDFGLDATVVPADPSGAAVVRLLADQLPKGATLLWVRGNLADPGLTEPLRAAGLSVSQAVGYDTRPSGEAPSLVRDVRAREVDVVTFSSGSAADAFADAWDDPLPPAVVLAALGPSTAASLKRRGLLPDVVAESTDFGDLLKALDRFDFGEGMFR